MVYGTVVFKALICLFFCLADASFPPLFLCFFYFSPIPLICVFSVSHKRFERSEKTELFSTGFVAAQSFKQIREGFSEKFFIIV